jgi:hypothetical protein
MDDGLLSVFEPPLFAEVPPVCSVECGICQPVGLHVVLASDVPESYSNIEVVDLVAE